MQNIYTFIEEALKNQIVAGLVTSSILVSLLIYLKQVPSYIFTILKWKYTCSLTIFQEDQFFYYLNDWLYKLQKHSTSRNMRITSVYEDSTHQFKNVPGVGKHLIWYKNKPLIVERSLPESKSISISNSDKRPENITITTFGSSTSTILEIIKEVNALFSDDTNDRVKVYLYRHHNWDLACKKPKRKLSSVVLRESQSESIINDIETFINKKPEYEDLGIPWKRGYLFEGPPGTGKTSFVLAIASYFNKPLYVLNMGSIGSDESLITAFSSVPENSIILMEDIDAIDVTKTREIEKPSNSKDNKTLTFVSLSCLLNVLDGVFSKEGRIIIMTTNHPEKIDPALLRRGRIDRREHFDKFTKEQVVQMAKRFKSSPTDDMVGQSGADLQELLIKETIIT